MRLQLNKLISFYFLFALFFLLLNDFYLKPTFHNTLTGKLSDFAGLFVFPIFWSAFFPRYRKVIFRSTGILFIIWKSPFSQPFIDNWNEVMFLSIDRVIDYTDLLALLVLPVAFCSEKFTFSNFQIKLHPAFPIIISAFAFMATSYKNEEEINKTYTLNISKDTFFEKMNKIENINHDNPIKFTSKKIDTIQFYMSLLDCRDVEVTLIVKEISENKTEINYLRVDNFCKEGAKKKGEWETEFEKKIIDKIK